ncbi:GNAT family N-acetyltransferase [Actinoplanes sp. LDG1-06]|uniref:GNAT family N-acetyltransferase n=1 Tax=Paractinoplanes ovalisporus TaxID=2810368 RepID=A0ABS2APG0_9ACTN|nr:GNAT family protein [Actinoplanes ovalisporus]MBM2621695.1 GNAT family N-acetyltransferase [Actinoplanes ovalisporus]
MERVTIRAGGVRLRPFVESDIPWVYEVSLDPLVQKYLQIPLPYQYSDAEFFVREMAIAAWDDGSRAEFVIEPADGDVRVESEAVAGADGGSRGGSGLDRAGAAQDGGSRSGLDPAAAPFGGLSVGAAFDRAAAVRNGGSRLGRVGFGLDRAGAAQIGYWMDPAARGRGVATAAVRALCGWGFDTLGLGLVEWRAEVGNHASRRVAEKAGFRVEATLRQRLVHRGVRVDAWIGSMVPSELPTRPG